ncbi:MAG TPA: ATP-dependent Clp protease ATP-binding subunit [Elusimicrobiota bacterium]|jgi:ATP-dependent Clp protease ATP-binding subunit ClpC|nr:ATP-dependent Clp protease ATP-binding subunit [Elusimicrobiota bacterium]
MTRSSRSPFAVLCSRATLAVFAATLPGPAAWAQFVERAAPVAVPAGLAGALGSSPSAPSLSAPSPLSSIFASNPAPSLAQALSAAPQAAPLPAAAAAARPSAAAALAGPAPLPAGSAPTAASALNAAAARSAAAAAPGMAPDGARALSERTFDAASTPDDPGGAAPVPAGEPAGDSNSGELRRRANKLDREILRSSRAGQLVSEDELIDKAASLGENASLAKHLIKILVGDGRFLALSGHRYVHTEIEERFDGLNPDARVDRAGELAKEGVRLLNGGTGLDARAKGAGLLGASYALLRDRSADAAAADEIKILFQNAALEVMRDVLREKVGREPYAFPIETLGKLQNLHFGAGLPDPELDARMRERLADIVRQERPNSPERGFDMVREMLLDRLPGDAPAPSSRAAAAPAEAGPLPPADFLALDKNDYENLLKYGVDLTQKAADGKLRPMIGRKAELRQIVKTLLRVEKNNPLVIGEKGVGKTAIINGLARMIVRGEIPQLRGKNVVKIDLNKVIAGTKYRGEFEERMQKILDEAKKSEGRVLLFVDEIHMIMGLGGAEGSADAAQMLKESLADGSISLIGATTMDEFRKIEKDGAMMRRFNPVKLLPPSKEEAEAIVEGVKPIYEKKHGVTIAPETVKAAVALAARYVTDRHLPDSALDLMDDASAEVELKASEAAREGKENPSKAVTPDDIAQEISMRTGIPAGKLNEDKKSQLKNLPAEMKGQVIGQDEAVEAVAEAVQAGETGYRDPKQPIASFVFLGPTGVGKTELARALAKIKFGSEKNMLRLDMSEYMEKHSVSRLISAPPGYVGHDEGGQLTEPIRRNPYQVILLDEIEKAHPDVFDILLQVLEDGRLTDGQGNTVDFSNTIIIMTSNIGGSLSQAGEEGGKAERSRRYLEAFKAKYRPEFVNRVGEDRVIVFNEIAEKSRLGLILDLRLKALENQLKDKGLKVALTDAAREAALDKALSQSQYGARPVKQIVDREINRALKDAELAGRIADGDAVLVDWDAAAGRYRADKAR